VEDAATTTKEVFVMVAEQTLTFVNPTFFYWYKLLGSSFMYTIMVKVEV